MMSLDPPRKLDVELAGLYGEHVTPNGAAIKALREAHGWSVRNLARRALISHTFLAQVEAGTRRARPERLGRIADALAVPLNAITREDIEMDSPPELALKLYTTKELSVLWSMTPDWLKRRAASGEIDATYVGFGQQRQLRFTHAQALAAMELWKVPAVNRPRPRGTRAA